MKKKRLFWAVMVILAMTSCRTTMYTARQIGVDHYNIDQKEMAVSVLPDYSHRITATSGFQTSRGEAAREAEFLCISGKKGVDVVIDPIFKIEYNPLRAKKRYRATVEGYPGMYETAKAGVDATMDYSREDIENYKLFTDPNFARYLYSKSEGDNYYFGDVNTTPQRKSIMLSTNSKQDGKAKVKTYDYSKSLKLKNAGVATTIAGLTSIVVIGIPCLSAKSNNKSNNYNNYNYYDNYNGSSYYQTNYAARSAGVAFISMGACAVAAGIPMWCIGAYRMKKGSNVDVNIGATSSGIGLGLTF